jgi:hypothetical protein
MLTSRTSVENSVIYAWVDNEGNPWIEQPFNPNTQDPWTSESQAKAWADNWIEEYNNRPEPTPLS